MGKGRSKRRRKANYLAAHDGVPLLAPAPSAKDLAAVPAKLRRIMELKVSPPCGLSSAEFCKNGSKNEDKVKALKKSRLPKEQSQAARPEGLVDLNHEQPTNDYHAISSVPSAETVGLKSKKRKRGQSLHILMENLKAVPVSKGLKERKKRYLEEKKKKGKRSQNQPLSAEPNSILQKQEKIGFGEIVQAPPKLLPPKKTNSISQERMRHQAIEAYRQRKGWLSRPGSHKPPSMTSTVLSGL